MPEALRAIKREFGSEAVILSARSLKKERGIFGNPKKTGVEVTAAIDSFLSEAKTQNTVKAVNGWVPQRKRGDDQNRSGVRTEMMKSFEDRITLGTDRPRQSIRRDTIPQNIQKLFMMHQQLLYQGVEEDISLELIGKIDRSAISDRLFETDAIKQCLTHILDEAGITARRVKLKPGNQKIVAFIGSTGVGKTTTIPKLAAAAKMKLNNKRVALITLDNYRIAAVEQLKIYAKIFGMPVETVGNNRELRRHIRKLREDDLILIDTAGLNPRNENRIRELNAYFEKLPSVEIHLLMSSTTKERTMDETLEKFQAVPIDRLIFTKLDECTTYGAILNQLFRSKIPVSYFTNGQQVPDDLMVATLEKLVDHLYMFPNHQEIWKGSPESLADSMTVFERMFNAVNKQSRAGMDSQKFARMRYNALS